MSKVPIAFSDIGKDCKDLLSKDYPTGAILLEVNTKASNGVSFTVSGSKDNKTGGITGDLKTKYSDKSRGLTLTESWSTANVLGAKIELTDPLTKGLRMELNASMVPNSGKQNAKVNLDYKQDFLNVKSCVDMFKGPTLSLDACTGAEGANIGGELTFDVNENRITRYGLALGYTTSEYNLALQGSNNLKLFTGSYYHRVNSTVEAGAKAIWDSEAPVSSNVTIELGTKYSLDQDAFVKAKIDNNGRLGLGYTQSLRPGVKVSLGGSFDTRRFNENAHKVGLSLTLES